jgi:DNA/RNA endonuclease YhcR with UshA esterase domain
MNKYFLLLFGFLVLFSCGKDKSDEISITKQENTERQNFVDEDPVTEPQDEETSEEIEESDEIISTKKVSDYIGKTVTVEGYVADVVKRPKVNYLNFDNKFPKHTFTVVIFPKDEENFEDLNTFKNKNVRAKGKIELYRGKPQIIVNSPEQINIVK